MFLKKLRSWLWPEMLCLAVLSAVVYVPRLWELTYNADDWYFMYDALVRGAGVFRDITLHTRPIRGPVYEILYTLFGPAPLPYHLTFFLWRLLGGFGALWLYNLLWPAQRRVNFSLAALFLVFPGFLWWVSGIEFQPYILSVGLQVFSIAFTLKAVQADSFMGRSLWTAAAVISGWAYLSLVEFAIGMEGFRLLCVYLLVRQKHMHLSAIRLVVQVLRSYAVFLLIPLSFVIWYQFIFENWRKAQDAGMQFGAIFSSPFTASWLVVRLLESALNISLAAWFVPFQDLFFAIRLRDVAVAAAGAAAAVGALLLGGAWIGRAVGGAEDRLNGDRAGWRIEALWLGLLGTLAGVAPIVLANRNVTFERVSHYTLPGSLAGVLLIGGLVYSIAPRKLQLVALSALVALAALSHHALAARTAVEQKSIADFWWQMAWRAPDIRDGTLLVVVYPNVQYVEGNEVVWGPANFIYNPEKQTAGPVTVPLAATRMDQEALTEIVMGTRDVQRVDLVIKYVSINYNYRNILVITQPAEQACAHVMDQRWPGISTADQPLVALSAGRSNTDNIVPRGPFRIPPEYLFGAEPAHDWCFYYQKADLARQEGDWDEVIRLGEAAGALGLHPNDQIEWMPFLMAHAWKGNEKQVRQISTRINIEPYYRQQACDALRVMTVHGYPLAPGMEAYAAGLFCHGDRP